MTSDGLSEVLDLVGVSSVLTGGIAARDGWWSHGPISDPVKFFAMVDGCARLSTDGVDAPVALEPGDVAILIGRSWVAFEAGQEPRKEVHPESGFSAERFASAGHSADDLLLGGCVNLDEAGRALLLGALPPVAHVRAPGDADRLRAAVLRLFDEASGDRIGSAFAIRQHAQLLLLEVLRTYAGQADLPPGLLRLLTDPRLRPAVELMHEQPARAWGLQDLAHAAAMSRTSFAQRFRKMAGVPPLTYLSRWRMLLAQRALRDGDVRVGELAGELGYSSESAFSTAFKRSIGESPLRYRQRMRQHAAVTAV